MENNFIVTQGYVITTMEKGKIVNIERSYEFDEFIGLAEKYLNLDKEEWEKLLHSKHVTSITALGVEVHFEEMVEVECGHCGKTTMLTTLELDFCEQEWDDEYLTCYSCEHCDRYFIVEEEEEE